MLLKAAREHNIDLTASWMIGDSEKDIEAGTRVGCKTARLIGDSKSTGGGADVHAPSLLAAIPKILELQAHSTATTSVEDGTSVVIKTA